MNKVEFCRKFSEGGEKGKLGELTIQGSNFYSEQYILARRLVNNIVLLNERNYTKKTTRNKRYLVASLLYKNYTIIKETDLMVLEGIRRHQELEANLIFKQTQHC